MAIKRCISQAEWETFRAEPSEKNFRPLYQNTKALIWTICLRILRDREDAADAMQSTYCRLLQLAQSPKGALPHEEIRQSVYRLAVREANNLRLRRSRRERKEVTVETLPNTPMTQPVADRLADQAIIRERVERIVETLPEHYRVPVLLHYFNGLSHSEVAIAMGTPVSTVSNRIARAHRKLEPMLKRAGLGGSLMLLATIQAQAGLLEPPLGLTAAAVFHGATASLLSHAGGLLKAKLSSAMSHKSFYSASKGAVYILALLTLTATVLTISTLHARQIGPTAPAAGMNASQTPVDATAPVRECGKGE